MKKYIILGCLALIAMTLILKSLEIPQNLYAGFIFLLASTVGVFSLLSLIGNVWCTFTYSEEDWIQKTNYDFYVVKPKKLMGFEEKVRWNASNLKDKEINSLGKNFLITLLVVITIITLLN